MIKAESKLINNNHLYITVTLDGYTSDIIEEAATILAKIQLNLKKSNDVSFEESAKVIMDTWIHTAELMGVHNESIH